MFQFDACLGDPYGNEGGKYDEKQVERFRSGREIERRSEDELEGSGEYFRRIGDGAFDLERVFAVRHVVDREGVRCPQFGPFVAALLYPVSVAGDLVSEIGYDEIERDVVLLVTEYDPFLRIEVFLSGDRLVSG